MVWGAAIGIALLTFAISRAQAADDLSFRFDGVSSSASDAFRQNMEEARRRVRDWWGPTFEQPIAIEVTPNQLRSMALVPAWRGERGRMIFGSRRVSTGEAATIH